MSEIGTIKQLYSAEEIRKRVKELAQDVYRYYDDRNEDFSILYVEKGARIFAESLREEIIRLDSVRGRYQGIFSITVSRTKGAGFLDEIKLENFQPQEIEGKNILLVEDIIDQGVTVDTILEKIKPVANDWKVCVLVDKTEHRKKAVQIDYAGFRVDSGWVVGVGMDVDEKGRDLPFLGIVDPSR